MLSQWRLLPQIAGLTVPEIHKIITRLELLTDLTVHTKADNNLRIHITIIYSVHTLMYTKARSSFIPSNKYNNIS